MTETTLSLSEFKRTLRFYLVVIYKWRDKEFADLLRRKKLDIRTRYEAGIRAHEAATHYNKVKTENV